MSAATAPFQASGTEGLEYESETVPRRKEISANFLVTRLMFFRHICLPSHAFNENLHFVEKFYFGKFSLEWYF